MLVPPTRTRKHADTFRQAQQHAGAFYRAPTRLNGWVSSLQPGGTGCVKVQLGAEDPIASIAQPRHYESVFIEMAV